MTQLETTIDTIRPLVEQEKARALKTIELHIQTYNQTKDFYDFKRVYNLFEELDNYEVEYNLEVEDQNGLYVGHYDWTLYDPDNNKYIKTYELERTLVG
jgi:hypothetical protein